jgi:hypothetical protein
MRHVETTAGRYTSRTPPDGEVKDRLELNQQAQPQLTESQRTAIFLRRDLEVKEAYIVALRQREHVLEQALARADARINELEADAARLRETEAAALRVPTTPRYWLADRLNSVPKRAPRAHRVLRAAFVRMTRLERSA